MVKYHIASVKMPVRFWSDALMKNEEMVPCTPEICGDE